MEKHAAHFDERGWAYYIREVYDAFYPGYGDSWPTFQGSIGNTYEQASARGLVFARRDGDTPLVLWRYLSRFVNPWSYIGRAQRLEKQAQVWRGLLQDAARAA